MEDSQICRPDGWFSVNDRMPECGKTVLVWVDSFNHGNGDYTLACLIDGEWFSTEGWDLKINFWQELPQKPNSDTQESNQPPYEDLYEIVKEFADKKRSQVFTGLDLDAKVKERVLVHFGISPEHYA